MTPSSSPSSSSRRKSIAVAHHAKSFRPTHKRRPHSITPGDAVLKQLSPAAKARRSAGPRKSILKPPDDFSAESSSATSTFRKSLGPSRRVSFATEAAVRVFDNNNNGNNNSSSSRRSSNQDAEDGGSGRRKSAMRRSTVRYSEFGEQSMVMDDDEDEDEVGGGRRVAVDSSPLPAGFMDASPLKDETFNDSLGLDYDDEDDAFAEGEGEEDMREDGGEGGEEDMDMSQTPIRRRRSSLAAIPQNDDDEGVDMDTGVDDEEEGGGHREEAESFEDSTGEFSREEEEQQQQHVEYTVPLSQSLRAPEPPSQALLDLMAVTHAAASTTPSSSQHPPSTSAHEDQEVYDEDGSADMDLTQATSRLLRYRDSLGLSALPDASFDNTISTVSSSASNNADQTTNFTALMRASFGAGSAGRASEGGELLGRPSEGGGSDMDVTTWRREEEQAEAETEPPSPTPDRAPVFSRKPPQSQSLSSSVAAPPTVPKTAAPALAASTGAHPHPNSNGGAGEEESVPPKPVFSRPGAPVFSRPKPPGSVSKPAPASSSKPTPAPSASKPTPTPSSPSKRPSPILLPASPTKPTSSRLPVPASPRIAGTAAFAGPTPKPTPKRYPALPVEADERVRVDDDGRAKIVTAGSGAGGAGGEVQPATAGDGEAGSISTTTTAATTATAGGPVDRRRTSSAGLRREPGYFARRKSLGVQQEAPQEKEKAWGRGRASVAADVFGRGTLERDEEIDLVRGVRRGEAEDGEGTDKRGNGDGPTPGYVRGSPMRPPPGMRASVARDDVDEDRMDLDVGAADTGSTSAGFGAGMSLDSRVVEVGSAAVDESSGGGGGDFPDEEEGPTISIEQFLTLTEVNFLGELTLPRRSLHPRQLAHTNPNHRRSSLGPDADAPLADFFIGLSVHVPLLELYTLVARDIDTWIAHSREIFRQAEEEAARMPPSLFREFLEAEEGTKEDLLHQLKIIRSHCRLNAMGQWYEWRMQWTDQLITSANEGFNALTQDAQKLESIIREAQAQLPPLKETHEQLQRELAEEQALVHEIEQADKEYLAELTGTISEQAEVLKSFRADVREAEAKYDETTERLAQAEREREEEAKAVAELERRLDKNVGDQRAQVAALRDELAELEALHLFRLTKVKPHSFELTYADHIHISLPCVSFRPLLSDTVISLTPTSRAHFKDAFPALTEAGIVLARAALSSEEFDRAGLKDVVRFLGCFWSGIAQIRTQLSFLAVKYPLSVELSPSSDPSKTTLRATASVLLHTARAKITISFVWDAHTLLAWPASVRGVRCEVRSVLEGRGGFDVGEICGAVEERIGVASADDNHGCLLDACIDATADFEGEGEA